MKYCLENVDVYKSNNELRSINYNLFKVLTRRVYREYGDRSSYVLFIFT